MAGRGAPHTHGGDSVHLVGEMGPERTTARFFLEQISAFKTEWQPLAAEFDEVVIDPDNPRRYPIRGGETGNELRDDLIAKFPAESKPVSQPVWDAWLRTRAWKLRSSR